MPIFVKAHKRNGKTVRGFTRVGNAARRALKIGGSVKPAFRAFIKSRLKKGTGFGYHDLMNQKGTSAQIAKFLKPFGAKVSSIKKMRRFETGKMTDAFVQNRYEKEVKLYVVEHEGGIREFNSLQALRFAAQDIHNKKTR